MPGGSDIGGDGSPGTILTGAGPARGLILGGIGAPGPHTPPLDSITGAPFPIGLTGWPFAAGPGDTGIVGFVAGEVSDIGTRDGPPLLNRDIRSGSSTGNILFIAESCSRYDLYLVHLSSPFSLPPGNVWNAP